jgi:hypothetical protein
MDSNRDESERCIQLAEHCIRNNQNDKALKFLLKADRLFPSPKAKGHYFNNYCFYRYFNFFHSFLSLFQFFSFVFIVISIFFSIVFIVISIVFIINYFFNSLIN